MKYSNVTYGYFASIIYFALYIAILRLRIHYRTKGNQKDELNISFDFSFRLFDQIWP